MAKLSSFKQDTGKAEDGVWVNGVMGDIDVKVARFNNPAFVKMFQKLTKQYRNLKTISDDVSKDIVNQCIANTVLLGWRNIQAEDGSDIPYSVEAAMTLLADPENVEFYRVVTDLSNEAEVFRKEVVEEIATKSQ